MPKIELTLEAKVDGLLKAIDGVGARLLQQDQKAEYHRKIREGTAQRNQESQARTKEALADKAGDRDIARQRRIHEATKEPSGGDDGGDPRDDRIRHSIRRRYTYAPETADIGRSLLGGIGGGVGQVAGYAQRGATAGASEGGGMLGGAAGLLRGTLIGAAALGVFKAGQALNEGYDMASERGHTLDTLKRQMGDVGVSFDRLKIASEAAASGLAINSKDFAAVEATLNAAAGRNVEGTPLGLTRAANISTGFARAYGLDPQATASMFGGAKNVDPKRQYSEFAGILAQTIERTGKSGSAAEVTQAVLSFAATASRLSMSQANISGYAGAYAGLTTMGLPGLTSEASAGILSQANAAASNMGAAGEAGQAFTLAAFNRKGAHLNPLEAMAEASSGLFGSRASTYGTGGAMEKLVGADRAARLGGRYTDASGKVHEGDTTTNFDMIKEQAERTAGGKGPEAKELQAEMLQRYYGLQSIQQAAALMEMKPQEMKGLDSTLTNAGVALKDVNYTNIQTVAKIGNTKTAAGLDDIYADMQTRTGSSALTEQDTKNVDKAKQSGDFGAYQNALVKATATKDYAQDSYTVQQQMAAGIDDLKIKAGDMMLSKVTEFESSMIALLGGRDALQKGRERDLDYLGNAKIAKIHADADRRAEAVLPWVSKDAAHDPANYQVGTYEQQQKIAKIYKEATAASNMVMAQTEQAKAESRPGADPLGEIQLTNHVHVYLDKDGKVKPGQDPTSVVRRVSANGKKPQPNVPAS